MVTLPDNVLEIERRHAADAKFHFDSDAVPVPVGRLLEIADSAHADRATLLTEYKALAAQLAAQEAPGDERVEEIRKRHEVDGETVSGTASVWHARFIKAYSDRAYLLSLFAATPMHHKQNATDAASETNDAAQAPRVDADATAINGHATVETIAGAYNWLSSGYPAQAQDFLRNALLAAGWKINDKFQWSYQEYPKAPTPAPTKAEVTREEIRRIAWDFALPGFDGAMADAVMALLRDKGAVR